MMIGRKYNACPPGEFCVDIGDDDGDGDGDGDHDGDHDGDGALSCELWAVVMMIGRKYIGCPLGETCGIGTVVIGRGAKGAKKGKERGDIWLDMLVESKFSNF